MQHEQLEKYPKAVEYLKQKIKEDLLASFPSEIGVEGMDIPDENLTELFLTVIEFNPSALFDKLDDKDIKIGIMPQEDGLWAFWNTYDNISNMAKTRLEANTNALVNAIICLDQILTKESDSTKES